MTYSAPSFLLAAVVLVSSMPAAAQVVERISISTSGEPANRLVDTLTRPSDDGRFVAFTTTATNLVSPDPTFTRDVFLRDRLLGTTTRVRTGGVAADLTPDGRLLLYQRTATAVSAVVDRVTDGEFALTTPPILSDPGAFSADGRFLLFLRGDAGLGAPREVVRREIAAGIDDLVSRTFAGLANTVLALPGHLSADGTIATFTTADPDIVPGDGNGRSDAFYKDYGFGFTARSSVDAWGLELPGDSSAGAVTADTRYFLFTTESAAVPEDTNGTWDLYVADRFLGELRRASISTSGDQGDGPTQCLNAWIAADGTRVVFDSAASNLVPGDTNGKRDIFEHDFSTRTTRRLVLGVGGAQADADLDLRAVSSDGRYLTVLSEAGNLVAGPAAADRQAYLVDLGPQCFVTNYCEGLPNSTGTGASIQSTGTPSFALDNFVLSSLDLPPSAIAAYFHGTTRLDPAAAFGNGLRCVGGTLTRLGVLQAVGGVVIQFQDLSGAGYVAVQPGDTRRFQLLYRDPAAGGAGFNTSGALEVTFCP